LPCCLFYEISLPASLRSVDRPQCRCSSQDFSPLLEGKQFQQLGGRQTDNKSEKQGTDYIVAGLEERKNNKRKTSRAIKRK
uniref:Uncharacterized protein n=1 Tax=Amphiprion percula TaxID=161767 RepID=A0A3P8TU07_AMPPE